MSKKIFKKTLKVKNVTNSTLYLVMNKDDEAYNFEPGEVREIPLDLIYLKTDGSGGELFVKVNGLEVVEKLEDTVLDPVKDRFEIMDL